MLCAHDADMDKNGLNVVIFLLECPVDVWLIVSCVKMKYVDLYQNYFSNLSYRLLCKN